jgi:hypothetical protein
MSMKSSSITPNPLLRFPRGFSSLQRKLAVGVALAAGSIAHAVVPLLMNGSADLAQYTNTPWTLQKTGVYTAGSPAGTGTVSWTVTVNQGTTTTSMVVAGYFDVTNNTTSAVPVQSLVVNLQRIVGSDFATVSSDVADSTSGDAATSATVDPDITYEGLSSFTENAASGSIALSDSANNPISLNSPVQSIPAGTTRRFYFAANFNANVLNIPTGEALQIEVIAGFQSFVFPSLSTLSSTTMPAPVVANGSVTLLDPSITASGTVTTDPFAGLNQVLTQGGSFPVGVTVTSGVNGGTVCNTATLTSPSTTIPFVLNNVVIPSIVVPGINLTANDCQNVPPPPGGPKLTVDSVNSCSQVVTYDASLFTSTNGPIVSATFTPVSGSTFAFGTTMVTYTVTDSAGVTATGTFPVNVIDTDAPVIVSLPDMTVPNDSGKCGAKVVYSTTATDCNLQSITYSPESGTEFPIGTTTVTVTATDAAGHQSNDTFTVTVTDTVAPTLHTTPVVVNNLPGTCGANVNFQSTADDCTQVTIIYSTSPTFSPTITSGTNFPVGTTLVYVKATDTTGNSSIGSFTVTVKDTDAPTLTVSNVTVNNTPGTCAANVPFAATADDCSAVALTYSLSPTFTPAIGSGASFTVGTHTVYVRAVDAAGNASTGSFTVTVLDADAPTLNLSNITVNNTPGSCSANVAFAATATDCSPTTIVYSLNSSLTPTIDSGANFPLGTTTVYVGATDTAGNVSNGSFTVTVKDAEAPVLHVTDYTVASVSGNCGATVNFAATATDCSAVTIIYSLNASFSSTILPGASFPVGTTIVYVKATDTTGNSSTGMFNVTVTQGGPGITIANITTNVVPGTCSAPVTFAATTSGCSSITVIYSLSSTFSPTITSGTPFPIGTTTVYAKATDATGKTATTSFTVTVVDNQPPVLTAPNILASVVPGTCNATVTFGATATDCRAITLVYSLSSTFSPTISGGGSFPIGTTTVYVKATDAGGNATIKSFTVTVVDNVAPVITAPNIVVNNDLNTCGAKVTFSASATDCSAVTLVYSLSSTCSPTIASGTTFPVGTSTVYVKATDAYGNTSTKTFTVTVKDAQPPTITSSLTNLTLQVDCGKCYATFSYVPKAVDNCAGAVTVTVSPPSGTQLAAGTTTTITVTATDSAGNSITKTFTVTVGACPPTQTTYTQGGWGAPPNGNNPGTLLWKYFSTVYPNGLTVGGTYTVKFTSASAITNALPLTGTPAVLTKSATNPTSGNTFMSQVVALKLNVDFSAKGLLFINQGSLGNMKVVSGKLAGYTVSQVLALCNKVLGGTTSALPSGVTVSDLTNICGSINGNFDNGTVNNGYLTY